MMKVSKTKRKTETFINKKSRSRMSKIKSISKIIPETLDINEYTDEEPVNESFLPYQNTSVKISDEK